MPPLHAPELSIHRSLARSRWGGKAARWRQPTLRQALDSVRGRALGFVLAALLLPGGPLCGQEPIGLPWEQSFAGQSLELSLARATLDVVYDPTATAGTVWVEIDPDSSASAPRRCTVVDPQGAPRLECPEPDRAVLLIVEAVLPAATQLRLGGSDLEASVATRNAVPDGPAGHLDFDLAASTLSLNGAVVTQGHLAGGELSIEALDGDLSLRLEQVEVRIQEHRGSSLQITAADSHIDVDRAHGELELELTDSEIALLSSPGTVRGTLTRSTLSSREHSGPAQIELRDSNLEIEDAPLDAELKVSGADSTLSLTRVGKITLELDRSHVQVSDSGGASLQLTGGSTVDIERPASLGIELRGGSEATVSGAGKVTATVADASFDLTGGAQLALTAERSRIALREVATIADWQVSDSELDVDLSATRRQPQLRFDGETKAVVRLRVPCFVDLVGRSSSVTSNLRLTGCELKTPQQRKRLQRGGLARLDGGTGSVLRLDMSPSSRVEVVGVD